MRPISLLGLSWRALRLHPRVVAASAAAVMVSFGGGLLVAPCAEPTQRAADAPVLAARGEQGVVVVEYDGLARASRVEVVAIATQEAGAAAQGYRARPMLVRTAAGERWVPGDVIAMRERDSMMSATADLDGDGAADQVWHAIARRTDEEDLRERHQGYLVFEGAAGVHLSELGYADGWGNEERVAASRLRDVVGGPSQDLIVVLDTSVCEVGPGGHLIAVYRFDGGVPARALSHAVHDPVAGTGLAQYEIGYFRFERHALRARTMVVALPHDPGPTRLVVRHESWTRNDRGAFDHAVEELPLRSADGHIIDALDGPPPGIDVGERLFAVVEDGRTRWVPQPRFAEPRFGAVFESYPTDAPSFLDWIDGFWDRL